MTFLCEITGNCNFKLKQLRNHANDSTVLLFWRHKSSYLSQKKSVFSLVQTGNSYRKWSRTQYETVQNHFWLLLENFASFTSTEAQD